MVLERLKRQKSAIICIGIIAATLIVYEPIRHNGFVNYDDGAYVTHNPNVTGGITRDSVLWAFTASYEANWHPLTWLSHILDCQLFGLNPVGHHLVSLLFHIANAILLFWILTNLTGSIWPSAFVAAVFALHPLQVDSVAWAAERKTVISGLFWLLTIAVYIRYTKRPGIGRYMLLFLVYGLCIMTKPVVVTLPLALLLLDYWPLGRAQWRHHAVITDPTESASKETGRQTASLGRLVMEKIPLLALSAVLSVITFIAQRSGEAVIPLASVPLGYRVANMFISYMIYIGKMIWPSRLAAFYPHPFVDFSNSAVVIAVVCASLFVLISFFSIYLGRRRRYVAVGWLWYVGTLVPVIGLVQAGGQGIASRYMYIPMLGLLIIVVWGIRDLLAHIRYRKIILSLSAAAVLLALGVVSRQQVGYWRSGVTLFKHATEVVPDNWWAYQLLGRALAQEGRFDEAINSYKEALRITPDSLDVINDMGYAMLQQGMLDEVIILYLQVLPEIPDAGEDISASPPNTTIPVAPKDGKLALTIRCYAEAHLNLGVAFDRQDAIDEAIKHYREALRVKPDFAIARKNLGNAFFRQGKLDQAIEQFEKYLQIVPDSAEIHANTAYALLQKGRPDEAIMHIREIIRMQPNSAVAYNMLGNIYQKQGNVSSAVEAFNKALELAKAGGDEELVRQIQAQLSGFESK